MATAADFDRIGNYARMYNPDQNIDRHKCKRVVPMEVLSLGYSRTGTLSMQKALSILGYANPYHFSSMYDNVQDCDMWLEALDAKYKGKGTFGKEQFDQLLGHVSAVTDMPCIVFAKELMEHYPDAKVVLVERNIDTWTESWNAFLQEAMNPMVYWIARLDPVFLGRISAVGWGYMEVMLGGAQTVRAAEARSREEYAKHYAYVRAITPKDRLLEYKLGSGWEPLCEFLGKPVPQGVDFPRINEKASMQLTFQEMMKKSMRGFLKNAVVAVSVLGIPAFAFYRYRNLSR